DHVHRAHIAGLLVHLDLNLAVLRHRNAHRAEVHPWDVVLRRDLDVVRPFLRDELLVLVDVGSLLRTEGRLLALRQRVPSPAMLPATPASDHLLSHLSVTRAAARGQAGVPAGRPVTAGASFALAQLLRRNL